MTVIVANSGVRRSHLAVKARRQRGRPPCTCSFAQEAPIPTPLSFCFKYLDPVFPSLLTHTALFSDQKLSGGQVDGCLPFWGKFSSLQIQARYTHPPHCISPPVFCLFEYAVPFARDTLLSFFVQPVSTQLLHQYITSFRKPSLTFLYHHVPGLSSSIACWSILGWGQAPFPAWVPAVSIHTKERDKRSKFKA